MSKNHIKHLLYAFEVYQDDITLRELKEICVASTLPCYISPIHDSDVYTSLAYKKYLENNPDSDVPFTVGEVKKAHWHVGVSLPYARPPKSALAFIQDNFSLLDVDYIVPYDYLPKMCRYWSHLDNPEKARYNPRDAISVNGFMVDLTKPTMPKPERDIVLDIMSFIKSTSGINFYKLFHHFYEDELARKYIEKHAYLVNLLIEGSKNNYENKNR